MKGRILKNARDFSAAASIVEQDRQLDLADRYINNKATKYFVRADRVAEAEATIALFTRHEGDPQQNIFDMQCMWYENAIGASHARQGAHGTFYVLCFPYFLANLRLKHCYYKSLHLVLGSCPTSI